MQITGFTKTYMIYQIKCNNTNKIYIGSTSNLTARINTHVSSFKTGVSHCSSVEVLKGNNYSITVLRDNILTIEETKLAELSFINAYGSHVVNVNKPILCDMKTYQKIYQKEYNNNKRIKI